ncbi:monovalent cation/H(+) antiporter subunit G [Aeromicrobium wangtongii]|uniref:Monovalent cation/H(+) antiporter subunit G n=1 Tax=Aeromicrobium wangtongii TaxID=2969247 RepID=A0ABY5M7G4_9ACTN|nr:monovalent cation/H(+) antiporter subunit G [Aeromicrobium wangtongii]MCD9199751.1 monovalent cation/H(+) antiporter subunit G [Aeromicrobium wangtongii]MCL3817502.1 monovalent cation/H(+) antiporter subunit G [Aeromicrobium wangtongii]UUP14100.1 monovalent cation/H(+) antiporter subunit G [Aeromicrobium wangtongii]
MIDVIAGALLIGGAAMAAIAAIGIVRFPDVLSRMHAATKPQTVGLLMILAGLGLRLQDLSAITVLFLIAVFQLLTAPVSAHMVGRAAFRTGFAKRDQLTVCELETDDDAA